MSSKIPVIGTIIGAIILAIGAYSLATSFGLQEVIIDDVYLVGDQEQYSFNSPAGIGQTLQISGDSFDISLHGPGIIRDESYKGSASIDWSHLENGRSILHIANTGSSELTVTGTVFISTDAIYIAYHGMVIISGIVILGFSAGFSKRKPRGF